MTTPDTDTPARAQAAHDPIAYADYLAIKAVWESEKQRLQDALKPFAAAIENLNPEWRHMHTVNIIKDYVANECGVGTITIQDLVMAAYTLQQNTATPPAAGD